MTRPLFKICNQVVAPVDRAKNGVSRLRDLQRRADSELQLMATDARLIKRVVAEVFSMKAKEAPIR